MMDLFIAGRNIVVAIMNLLSNSLLGRNFVITRILFFFRSSEEHDPMLEDILELCFGIVAGVLCPIIIFSYLIWKYLEDNHMWIGREWRLLDALSKDFQTAYKSVEQIKQKANHVWESELSFEDIILTLSQNETQWVKSTVKATSEAERCTEEFEKLVLEKPNFFMKLFSFVKKPISILDLAFGMRRTKSDILEYKKQDTNDIIGSLEDSRIKVRSLQDRPIDETYQTPVLPVLPFRSGVVLVLERLLTEKSSLIRGTAKQIRFILVHLQLLRAFLKDLQKLRLESEVENVWLDEAKKITAQAQNAISASLQEAAHEIRWLSILCDYCGLRRKFKKSMKKVGSELSHLLETKEIYGFNFISRSPSKDNTGDILPLVKRARTQMMDLVLRLPTNMPHSVGSRLTYLLKSLEDTLKLLLAQEAAEGAINTRKACVELVKKIISDAESCINKDLRWGEIHEIHELLKRCTQVYSIKVMKESCSVVGLEEDIHDLVLKLATRTNNEAHSVISIVGMRGIGKTTLAKEVCNHRSIINRFNVRRLVSLPEESDETRLVQFIGNKILQTEDNRNEEDYWINKLQVFLREKSCLIVLDNLLSRETWDKLKPALLPAGSRSTIMLTTRNKAIASHSSPSNIHLLRLRTQEESWEFFTQMVHCPSDPQEVEKLAKQVVARTGGLPLAILRLGYLLSGKRVTKEELLVVLERVSQGNNQIPWVSTWETNKADLQAQSILEKCLSYFELFKKDFEIPTRRLVALWVARGLAQVAEDADELNEEITQEKVAYGYLLELIGRNLIQIVKRKRNGKVLTCRFPSTLKELWSKDRRNTRTPRSWSVCASFDRQLAYRFDDDDDGSYSRSIHGLDLNVLREDNCPLSITFIDSREGNKPGEDVGIFLIQGIANGNFQDLLVLDLEGVFKPHLPSTIGKLKQLIYLGLRWTYLESLPSSIGKLLNLQTLDLKHTRLRTLPSSVWKLKKLRHLHLNQHCRIKLMPQPSAISMKNLHKLSGVFVDHECRALMDGLHKLNNLRKLRLSFQLTLPQQEVLSRSILQLTNLKYLSLRSVNESSEPQPLRLEPFVHLQKLSSLYLFGKLERLCHISELPESLTELTLSHSRLSRGGLQLHILGALPELKYLSFLSDSYRDAEMVFSCGGFPKLLVLKLWKLHNLSTLVIGEGAMQELRELEIRSCFNLTAFTGVTHLRALQELKLTDMPEKYAAEVEQEFAQLRNNLRI